MIYLLADDEVEIYVTFTEKMESDNYILLRLFDETYPNKYYNVLLNDNISTIQNRIDIYKIKETNVVDYSLHEIHLPHDGMYIYKAFELDLKKDQIITNTFIDNIEDNILKQIEIGRCKLMGKTNDLDIDDVYK